MFNFYLLFVKDCPIFNYCNIFTTYYTICRIKSNYLLIKGEAVEKYNNFNHNNPGLRIKILYLDLDLGEPTYNILKIFWNKVVKNGIVVFDEYAHHHWDESVGVDKFLKEIEGQYEFIDTKIYTPSAYIKKLVI